MLILFVAVAIAIVAGVAVLIARDRPVIEPDPVTGPPLRWPPEGPVTPESVVEVRFPVVVRGYRMDEVDAVLDDVRAALAERDRRIAALEGAAATADDPIPGEQPVAAARGRHAAVGAELDGPGQELGESGTPAAEADPVPGDEPESPDDPRDEPGVEPGVDPRTALAREQP